MGRSGEGRVCVPHGRPRRILRALGVHLCCSAVEMRPTVEELDEAGALVDRRREDGDSAGEEGRARPYGGSALRSPEFIYKGRAGVFTISLLLLLCSGLLGGGGLVATQAQEVPRADYDTNCGLGFAGLHCGEVQTCEELDYCTGHGICVRGGSCVCDVGWEGPTCAESNCPSNCSGHGSCAATGGCVCDAGYKGVICDSVECLGGGNCTGHGECLEGGVCVCDKGYVGGGCERIDVAEKRVVSMLIQRRELRQRVRRRIL